MAREGLRDWAQLEPRHRLARATHRISVLTEGVLTMQTTLLGVVKVDPKELLTDGIRRELVLQLTRALQSGLTFKQGKPAELEAALARLGTQVRTRAEPRVLRMAVRFALCIPIRSPCGSPSDLHPPNQPSHLTPTATPLAPSR